jgi:hypothetical protein
MSAPADYANVVQELYVTYLGRPAEPAGLQYYEALLAAAGAPVTLAQVAGAYGTDPAVTGLINEIGNSRESGGLFGSAAATHQFVTAIYQNLFGRTPDTGGLDFWSEALLTGRMTTGQAAMEIALAAASPDAASVTNKTAAATIFTTVFIAHNGGASYNGEGPAAQGRAFLAGINGTTTPAAYRAGAGTAVDHLLGISPPSDPPSDPPSNPVVALSAAGDAIHLNGTAAASTVDLAGADATAFPSASYGTVALLISAGVTSVTNSGGNFILDASGNHSATTFDFGSGATGGADAVSAAGITYQGVTGYVTSSHGDTVTLSAAGQNVTASGDGNTINLGALAYSGTLDLAAGAGGTDTIHATVGGNLGGAAITGGSNAHIALVLSGAGTETLSTGQYNLINVTSGGGITFTGGAPGANTIAFSDAGTVTAIADASNYQLSAAGNNITLSGAAQNVKSFGNGNTVNLGALAYTGMLDLSAGTAGTDTITATVGGDLGGATLAGGNGAHIALVLSGSGTETLSTGEYNLINVTSGGGITFTGGSAGANTIAFSDAGTVAGIAGVGNYRLSGAGNTITLSAATQNVTSHGNGNTVNLGALTYTGTLDFSAGTAGTDTLHATVGGNLGGATIAGGGGQIALALSGTGTETLSTGQYNLFTGVSGGGITFSVGGSGAQTIAFSNAGAVTAIAGVGNYHLSSAGNSITLTSASQDVTSFGNGNTINLGALAYTGTLNLAAGTAGTDTIHATVGGDLRGITLTGGGGAQVALALSGAGTETLNAADYNLFNASGGGITFAGGGGAGANTIAFASAGAVTEIASVGNYDLSSAGNTITLTSTSANVNGAASGDNIVRLAQAGYTGTLAFGAAGTDIVQAPTNGDFSGLTVTSGGATLKWMITGVAAGIPGGITTSTEIYNAFTTGPHGGGIVFPAGGDSNPADYVMTFSDQGTVTDSANIGNYNLNAAVHSTINDLYTFTIANNAADNITEFSAATGGSTYHINVSTFTGSLTLGGSGDDAIVVASGSDISGASITSAGTTASLTIGGSGGAVTVSSAEAALFHDAPSAISASGGTTFNVADSLSSINLSAQENALATVGLQAGNNTVNVSIGAASINAGAAGFNQTLVENGAGNNTFNIDNGGAAIIGASDASHYVTINNFNTTSDNINLTLSGNAQNAGEQDISDSGNDVITVGVNSVIVEEDLGAIPGFTVFNATDLSQAQANILRAINAGASTTGAYTFIIDSNQGAAIYEIHVNSGASTLDGIQLIGVVHGVGAFNLVGHVS